MILKKIRQPELFQGSLKKKNYFEGWYFKLVSADCSQTLALIPGVSLEASDSHSFVQVILSSNHNPNHNPNHTPKPNPQTYYFKYPLEAFKTTEEPFSVTVGKNHFSLQGCHIDLEMSEKSSNHASGDAGADVIRFTGDIQFFNLTPIQSTALMPNIMGFFAYIPNMECNHGVMSMNHNLKGHIDLGSHERIDFYGGRGYMEKDWGTSFPKAYIWIAANHFENAGDSFMCSIATIPFGVFSFQGLIANLILEGVEYRFATYNWTRVKNLKIGKNYVRFELKKGKTTLTCEAKLLDAGELKAPHRGEMQRTIKEGLSGEVVLTLKQKNKAPRLLKSTSAGIEIVE